MCNKVLLVGLSNPNEVKEALDAFYPDDVYMLDNSAIVVATELDTNAKIVGKQLDFVNHQDRGKGLISELTYMTGYYDSGFFEWMSKRENTVNHCIS